MLSFLYNFHIFPCLCRFIRIYYYFLQYFITYHNIPKYTIIYPNLTENNILNLVKLNFYQIPNHTELLPKLKSYWAFTKTQIILNFNQNSNHTELLQNHNMIMFHVGNHTESLIKKGFSNISWSLGGGAPWFQIPNPKNCLKVDPPPRSFFPIFST